MFFMPTESFKLKALNAGGLMSGIESVYGKREYVPLCNCNAGSDCEIS